MVTALNIANNILLRSFEEQEDVTPMKLQKLLYFVYKRYLQQTGKPLFAERFEVWKYGPVVRSVYDEFSYKKSNRIDKYASDCDGKAYIGDENSKDLKDALDYVWYKYKNYDGVFLSELTHRPQTAWYRADKSNKVYLEDDDIKEEEFY